MIIQYSSLVIRDLDVENIGRLELSEEGNVTPFDETGEPIATYWNPSEVDNLIAALEKVREIRVSRLRG